jgi:nucleotide-binding universal stress UspA family protein
VRLIEGTFGDEGSDMSAIELQPEQPEQPEPEHRIVVGIDGSDPSLAALGWAVRQAELTQARLEVVTTWEWPTSYGWAPAIPSDYDPAGDAERMVEDTLSKTRTEHPAVDIRLLVVEGHPAAVLVHASREADVLVVGSRGHGGFPGMLLGSVSQHCAANAHCPVVVVHGQAPDVAKQRSSGSSGPQG